MTTGARDTSFYSGSIRSGFSTRGQYSPTARHMPQTASYPRLSMGTTRTSVCWSVGFALGICLIVGCSSTVSHLALSPRRRRAASLVCPLVPPRAPPSSEVQALVSRFVPGDPTAVRACRYHGYDQPQPYGSLASTARFAARPIVTALNKARRTSEDPAFGCPTDLGGRIVLVFGYRGGSPVLITVRTSGCEVLTNGVIDIWMPTALVNRLERVLGYDRYP
jgi:hypothetical protein